MISCSARVRHGYPDLRVREQSVYRSREIGYTLKAYSIQIVTKLLMVLNTITFARIGTKLSYAAFARVNETGYQMRLVEY